MVQIDVRIAQRMDEVTGLQARHLCHHHEQQGIGGDVERHAQEGVGAALVELQAEPSVGHIELEEHVAGREVHAVQVGHVPRAHDDASRVGIVLQGVHDLLYLVDVASVVVWP